MSSVLLRLSLNNCTLQNVTCNATKAQISRPIQRWSHMSLSECRFVKKGTAKIAKGGRLRAKRMQSGKRAKAMRPALFPELHQALWTVYWGIYSATDGPDERWNNHSLCEGAI